MSDKSNCLKMTLYTSVFLIMITARVREIEQAPHLDHEFSNTIIEDSRSRLSTKVLKKLDFVDHAQCIHMMDHDLHLDHHPSNFSLFSHIMTADFSVV